MFSENRAPSQSCLHMDFAVYTLSDTLPLISVTVLWASVLKYVFDIFDKEVPM